MGHGDGGRPLGAQRCTATSKGSGNRCGNPAVRGATVCSTHGGMAPQVQRAAKRTLVRREAMRFAPGLERDEDPAEVLLAELRRSRALAAYWEDRLQRGEVPLWAASKTGPVPTVETELWQRERDRAVHIAAVCLKLGLEERRVRVAEQVGDGLFAALEAVAGQLGVDPATDQGRLVLDAGVQAFERTLGATITAT